MKWKITELKIIRKNGRYKRQSSMGVCIICASRKRTEQNKAMFQERFSETKTAVTLLASRAACCPGENSYRWIKIYLCKVTEICKQKKHTYWLLGHEIKFSVM